jgi:hypothetical protein
MSGIPPALDNDAEDVAWALQTAEALWRRNERVDAIVWLRRAAQAAGDAEDDDRALALARGAAELAESLAQDRRAPSARSVPAAAQAPIASEAVDDLLRHAQPAEDVVTPPTAAIVPVAAEAIAAPAVGAPAVAAPAVAAVPTGSVPHVPTAAEAHAGMLDPWADGEGRYQPATTTAPLPPPLPARAKFNAEEVVTSAPVVAPPVPPPPAEAPPPSPPPPAPSAPQLAPTNGVDLTRVEALSDLPDDAREAFARAAVVRELGAEDEVSGFALALVLEGSVDLTATIVDAPAQRFEAGGILRARGTIESIAPVRLVGVSQRSRVATWDERAVAEAFGTCPWVEDELRAAGDRLQALVGLTMGPLGERLDPSLRADVTRRLRLRALAKHEVLATQGQPVPGLLVVGAGELELLEEGGAPSGTVVRAGEFLFPSEALRAAPAPMTARAAAGGALVLQAERGVAQELLVTCPPLLEIFGGA